mgnify:FL=1
MDLKAAVFKIVLMLILSGVIGWEREKYHKPAGFRTHILVGIGSTLIMMVSLNVAKNFPNTQADPGRIAAQVVSGIGFLGAGTIIREGFSVKGLTTAASLWAIAATGLAIGGEFYIIGIFTALVVFIALFFFTLIEKQIGKYIHKKLICRVKDNNEILDQLEQVFRKKGIEQNNMNIERNKSENELLLEIDLIINNKLDQNKITRELLTIESIKEINWNLG